MEFILQIGIQLLFSYINSYIFYSYMLPSEFESAGKSVFLSNKQKDKQKKSSHNLLSQHKTNYKQKQHGCYTADSFSIESSKKLSTFPMQLEWDSPKAKLDPKKKAKLQDIMSYFSQQVKKVDKTPKGVQSQDNGARMSLQQTKQNGIKQYLEQNLVEGSFFNKIQKKLSQNMQIISYVRYNSSKQQVRFQFQCKVGGQSLNTKRSQDLENYQILEDLEDKAPQFMPYLIYSLQQESRPTQSQIKKTEKYVSANIKFLDRFSYCDYARDFCVPLILLKQQIQSQSNLGQRVIFQDFQDINTVLSIKNICLKLYSEIVFFTYKIEQNDIYSFDILIQPKNQIRLRQFVQGQKQKLAEIFRVQQKDIYIFKIKKGSLEVHAGVITNQSDALIQQKCGFTALFRNYRLSQSCFDQKYICIFKQWLCEEYLDKRGSFPYYPPTFCKRYGLNVKGKFKDNQWIGLEHQSKKHWAIGMHGSDIWKKSNAQNANKATNLTIIQSMLKGFKSNKMLLQGNNQMHQGFSNARNQQQRIKRGVYFTPQYQKALGHYGKALQQNLQNKKIYGKNSYHKKFSSVIQCRLHPCHIQISPEPQNHNIWVVNQSKHIRPYGIIISLRGNIQRTQKYFQRVRQLYLPQLGRYERTFKFNYFQWQEQISEYCRNFEKTQIREKSTLKIRNSGANLSINH